MVNGNCSIQNLDILVPVYNEMHCLEEFINRTSAALDKSRFDYNIILINDGSTDNSLEIIKNVCSNNNKCGYISFSRNFGKEAAIKAGLNNSNADAAVIIDADLQDPPELIPDLALMLDEKKVDVVFARRRSRKGENWLKIKSASVFYWLFDCLSRFNFPRETGDFRIIKRRVVKVLQELNETNPFMKGMFAWVGFEQLAFDYDRESRYSGQTKFNFWKLWNFAIDGITAFTVIPLKLATYIGLLFALMAMLYGFFFMLKTLIWGDPVKGFPTLIVALSFFSGIQLMFLGIIGEYLGRMHEEIKKRPLYIIDEISIS